MAVGTIVLLLVIATMVLNSTPIQNRLMAKAVATLSERLETRVDVRHVDVSLWTQEVELNGVEIDDRQGRKLFEMQHLDVRITFWPLLKREVHISRARITGLKAQLYRQPEDSVANYQFVIDAFKKKKDQPTEEVQGSTPKKELITLNIKRFEIEDVAANYNDNRVALQSIQYQKNAHGKQFLKLKHAETTWIQHTKKGDVENRTQMKLLTYDERHGERKVDIEGAEWCTDNHLPRKNTHRPKRGFFDVGHLQLTADLHLLVQEVTKDSIAAVLTQAEVKDSVAGIHVQTLQAGIQATAKKIYLQDVRLAWNNTEVQFEEGQLVLPSKKDNRSLSYTTSTITGKACLKDISRTFAPVLSNFTLPLQLTTRLEGTDNSMTFKDVHVFTADKRLDVKAQGGIRDLKDKYKMVIHFDIQQMKARQGIAKDIIQQFPVKKFMMKQLDNLGVIRYKGQMDIIWKQEWFQGLLKTEVGDLNFRFGINDQTHYLTGSVRTDSVELGKAINMKQIGRTACSADFKFDISKQRTALMRKQKGGKLPIGSVQAQVHEVTFKKIRFRNINSDIQSDGAEAVGKVAIKGKHTDLLCSFVFDNTDAIHKMNIKPGIRFHGLSDEDRAKKEQEKQAKQEEKEKRKLARAEEKALRKQQKAAAKAAKAEAKAKRDSL